MLASIADSSVRPIRTILAIHDTQYGRHNIADMILLSSGTLHTVRNITGIRLRQKIAVTIFAIEIEITIFDQNRQKIESSISLSQSYDFQQSKRRSFNDGCQQITLRIVNLASRYQFVNTGPEVERKASMT